MRVHELLLAIEVHINKHLNKHNNIKKHDLTSYCLEMYIEKNHTNEAKVKNSMKLPLEQAYLEYTCMCEHMKRTTMLFLLNSDK